MKKTTIAIIGCGLGGTAIAALLQRNGYTVNIYEQSKSLTQTGAGIHLTPNMLMALKGIDIESEIAKQGFLPSGYNSKEAKTAEVLFNLPLAESEKTYGGKYVTIQRSKFHKILHSKIKAGSIQYDKKLIHIEQNESNVSLTFLDGEILTADFVIAADGISSCIRNSISREAASQFSGQVAFRSVVSSSRINQVILDDYTKWWDSDRFIVSYYLDKQKKFFYFIAGFQCDSWPSNTSSLPGDHTELLDIFSDFHSSIFSALEASTGERKWPLYERNPDPMWYQGRIVMLGDACHPMRPHMAQGAAMAIEDGVILFRCIQNIGLENWSDVLTTYKEIRFDRVSKIQNMSNRSNWLQYPTDPHWLFSYDAWSENII